MFEIISLGILSSLVANGIQGLGNIISKDSVREYIEDIIEKIQKDFVNKFPQIGKSDIFLVRQENLEIICNWILNENINGERPSLNEQNYDDSLVTAEQKDFLFQRINYHIKNNNTLRNYCSYEMIKETNNLMRDIKLTNGNTVLSKKLVEQLNEISNLFERVFKQCIWNQPINMDVKNYIFTGQENSLDMCFFNLNMLFRNLNREIFNELSGKVIENEVESLVYLLKKRFQDKSVKISYKYNNSLRHINKLLNNTSIKVPEYYISLGQLQIESSDEDSAIYIKVLNEIIMFNNEIISLLREALRSKDFESYDTKTLEIMHSFLLRDIKFSLNEDNIKYIKKIYDLNCVIDTDLAEIFSIDIEQLRDKLYPLIKDILCINYNDHYSTKLTIKHYYRDTIEKHYDEIFGQELTL